MRIVGGAGPKPVGQPYAPYFGIEAPPRRVSGRVGRKATRVRVAVVGVTFVAEEDVAAADVFVLVGVCVG